jgi:hypothetical protein
VGSWENKSAVQSVNHRSGIERSKPRTPVLEEVLESMAGVLAAWRQLQAEQAAAADHQYLGFGIRKSQQS